MNLLIERFGPEKLAVLAFPTNQFGHQENGDKEEILNTLKYVRPGCNFEPKCDIFDKIHVNGSGAHPLFKFLRSSLPTPHDDSVSLMADPKSIIWAPVTRNDIAWNFEKFLIDANGRPFRRYSKKFETIDLEDDIKTLLAARK